MTHAVDPRVALDEINRRIEGRVLTPTDEAYAGLATAWNLAVRSTPSAVVRVASAADVAIVVSIANDHGLRVDVRATGHGAYPADTNTVLVHTVDLDDVVINEHGWARIGAGVRWSAVLDAAEPLGFGALCGSAPEVGVVGFLTGGGIGPVSRTYGMGSDHVRAFEVVTGNGELRRVTPEADPDLFRGLCGGKGALGIVTAVEIDLLPQPTIYGGSLYFDGADGATVLRRWRRWSDTLPVEATTTLVVLNLPPGSDLSPTLLGRRIVAVRFAWTGNPGEGEATIAPMHDVAPVLLADLGAMPFSQVGRIHADPTDPLPFVENGLLLSALDDEAVDALFAVAGPEADNPQGVIEVRQLGGAVAHRPARGDVVSHRDAAYALVAAGVGVPPLREPTLAHWARVATALAPWTRAGALPNVGGAATPAGAARTYDAPALAFLAQLVATHDPRSVLTCADAVRDAAASNRSIARCR